jgi:hypothetical protein
LFKHMDQTLAYQACDMPGQGASAAGSHTRANLCAVWVRPLGRVVAVAGHNMHLLWGHYSYQTRRT